jgi:hypothetical protein
MKFYIEFMPAISQETLVWLLLNFSTSPSKTTIQIAIDSNLGHPHLLCRVLKLSGGGGVTPGLQHCSKCAF